MMPANYDQKKAQSCKGYKQPYIPSVDSNTNQSSHILNGNAIGNNHEDKSESTDMNMS